MAQDAAASEQKTGMQKLLDVVERVGNRVPHPVVIFVILIGIVIVLSTVLSLIGAAVSYDVYNTETGTIERTTTEARSLLTIAGIRFMYTGVVGNFMSFQAVGVIIVAMVGVGVAEESGLIKALIRKLVAITNDAIALVDRNRSVGLLSHQWFEIGSTLFLAVVVAKITERIIEPRLGPYTGDYTLPDDVPNEMEVEERGLRAALWAFLGAIAFICLLTLPPGAPLRDPATGDIIGNTPFMASLIVSIALIFVSAGGAYGHAAGTLKGASAVVAAMQKALGSLSGLILLLLVISQFIAYFNYSNMATLAAVALADILTELNLDALWLLLGFILVVFLLDLIITGAIPKWAIFAPIFVPLLMRLGVEPDAVLAAYRVGDSPMNAITPLNAYFALIVSFAQRYQKDSGVGTVIALMLPYIAVMCVTWTILFVAWHLAGLPWGL